MKVLGSVRPLRRLWPRKVRTRLTLIYAAPFLVAGLAVFGLALFVLQKTILPTSPTPSLIASGKLSGHVAQLCQAYSMTGTSLCEHAYAAYYAGTVAGMQAQQNTLAKLLGFWALGLGLMTFASGGLGWYISGRLLRPVREITATARRASEQHLGMLSCLVHQPMHVGRLRRQRHSGWKFELQIERHVAVREIRRADQLVPAPPREARCNCKHHDGKGPRCAPACRRGNGRGCRRNIGLLRIR